MKAKNKKNLQNKEVLTKKSTKTRLFYFITFLIPVVFFALLEVVLRLTNYGGDTTLFVPTPLEDSKYYGINLNIGQRYFFMQKTTPTPRKDLFLINKPDNAYRIFVLGGSSAAGYPYGNNMMFSRILHYRLTDTFPELHIEMVNTALTAINTYTLLDFMDEIIEQKPDALLIYAGHNEFYGALGAASVESLGKVRWGVNFFLKLQRFKTFLLLRSIITRIMSWLGPEPNNKASDASDTMMKRIVKEQTIPLGSPLYNLGKEQFKRNLTDIFQIAKENNIPVMISELVSNIRDHSPFISIKSDSLPPAKQLYKQAQIQEKSQAFDNARKTYYRAKDLDALRFRATEEFNQIIHHQAAEFDIPVVPMKSYFEGASPKGLIGNNLILEHLHPNADGYFLMAEAFYNSMRKTGFIRADWDTLNIKPASYYKKNWGFTKLDSAYAALNIVQLKGGWPFKTNPGPNVALYKYKPLTIEDSIALHSVQTGKSTLETGHMNLADYYVAKGQYEQAFQEYKALLYIVPYEYLFYERAAQLLLMMGAYDRALPVLNQAATIKESAFVLKWSGQIYLRRNQLQKSISLLEKARSLSSNDPQLLDNLCRAYLKASQFDKANLVFEQFKRTNPNPQDLNRLEAFRKSYIKEAQN